jgi:hypothetical protein
MFLEFKQPGKKPRPGQIKRMRFMVRSGYNAKWADNLTAAKRITRRFARNAKITEIPE